MIKLEVIKYVYPDISVIKVPFVILILILIVIIGIIIYFANEELKNKGE